MSVYVGKDVSVIIQVPVYDELARIPADPGPYTVTVVKTPISDRDQDGVADEVAHVTVVEQVTGNSITPVSVVDATGVITFNAGDAGKAIYISYRYDLNPNLTQELTIEPKQSVEGVDSLGSDVIQQWAILLKEFSGSIKEAWKQGSKDRWDRIAKPKGVSKYGQDFPNSGALNDFDVVGTYTVESGALKCSGDGVCYLKTSVLPAFMNGIIRSKIKHTGGWQGWAFRRNAANTKFYIVRFTNTRELLIQRYTDPVYTTLLLSDANVIPADTWKSVEIRFVDDIITVEVEGGKIFSVRDPEPHLFNGQPGFANLQAAGYWDDFQVCQEVGMAEYGMIVSWSQGGSAVKIGLDKVVFPEGSIPSPKNAPVFITTPFKAMTAKTIS